MFTIFLLTITFWMTVVSNCEAAQCYACTIEKGIPGNDNGFKNCDKGPPTFSNGTKSVKKCDSDTCMKTTFGESVVIRDCWGHEKCVGLEIGKCHTVRASTWNGINSKCGAPHRRTGDSGLMNFTKGEADLQKLKSIEYSKQTEVKARLCLCKGNLCLPHDGAILVEVSKKTTIGALMIITCYQILS